MAVPPKQSFLQTLVGCSFLTFLVTSCRGKDPIFQCLYTAWDAHLSEVNTSTPLFGRSFKLLFLLPKLLGHQYMKLLFWTRCRLACAASWTCVETSGDHLILGLLSASCPLILFSSTLDITSMVHASVLSTLRASSAVPAHTCLTAWILSVT